MLVRRLIAAILALVAVSVLLVRPGSALGDGDPASDILLAQQVFIPTELSEVAPAAQQLQRELAAAAKAGFPIRVALIDTAADLGTVSALWDKPAEYAFYLHKELSLDYGGQVLVLMPGGYGLQGPASGPHAVTKAEFKVSAPTPSAGEDLAAAAAVAVAKLAAVTGHPLPASALKADGPAAAGGSGGGGLQWIVLAVGAVLIVAAWGVSLRARPLQWGRKAAA